MQWWGDDAFVGVWVSVAVVAENVVAVNAAVVED